MNRTPTPREAEVFELFAKGLQSSDVAIVLGCSKRTVDFHSQNVFQKLEVGSRFEALKALGYVHVNEWVKV